MKMRHPAGRLLVLFIATGLLCVHANPVDAAQSAKVFRVCGDPDNLPFSDQKLAGFDNKIAAVIAADLGAKVEYFWWPHQRGLTRNTIDKDKCDVVFGIPKGYDLLMWTKPYYRSSYVLAYRRDRKYRITSLDAPELKRLKVGTNSGTPAEEALARRDILNNVTSYTLFFTEGHEDHPTKLVSDLVAGVVDVATPWGPFAGYFAKKLNAPLELVPLRDETNLPLSFDISIGVKKGNQALKTQIEGALDRRQKDIRAILEEYGVPLAAPRPAAPATPASKGSSSRARDVAPAPALLASHARTDSRRASSDAVRIVNMQSATAKPVPKAATAKPVAGGTSKNPLTGNAAAIKQGREIYSLQGCAGCHGAGGGGGMGPSLIDDKWQFGSTDKILYDQITGRTKGTMPKVYEKLPANDVWKMLAFIRTLYVGDPKKKDW
jgi:mxaJ protein